ncbi:MAG: ribosomal-processing cysteine protease Prp [Clostridia bacterium]|nr:ribosomal-processing cysteine protease Prp [Clostridia bacterium]
MITIEFEQDALKGVYCLKVKGHADFDEYGKDIVCSAVSILTYTVAKAVSFMYEEKKLYKKPNVILEDGNATVICKPKEAFHEEALHILLVAEVGYSLLEQAYPDHVKLKPFGKA